MSTSCCIMSFHGQLAYIATIFSIKRTVRSSNIKKTVTMSNGFFISKIYALFKMEEEEGFEPPRALTPLSVFKTDPFSQTWVFLPNNIL